MRFISSIALVIALLWMPCMVIADVSTGEIGAGALPGDQSSRICVQHRDIHIGDETGSGINTFDYRTGSYAFAGEQIEYTIVVRDTNGALDIGHAYIGTASGETNFEDAIINGAERLVSLQNPDGGWAWLASGGSSTTNTLGVTAIGVLRAYQLTGQSHYLDSLEEAYNFAVSKAPVYTGTSETTAGVDSCPDFTWLVQLSEVTHDPKYALLAKQRYDNKISVYGSATAWAEYIRDARIGQGYSNGIIPWDIDKCVKAAVALDRYFVEVQYEQHARDMAEVIYNSMYNAPVIFDPEDATEGWYVLGLTGAVDSLWATGLHPTEYSQVKSLLQSEQNPDGGWPESDTYPDSETQTTAYSIVEAMKTGLYEEGIYGAYWLLFDQLPSKGWSNPENNEVTGESIDALYHAHAKPLPHLQYMPVALCSELPISVETVESCDGFGNLNPLTDKKFQCIYTVEPFRYGTTSIGIFTSNHAALTQQAIHTEDWFLNPAISLAVETSDGFAVHFETMPAGADTAPERTVHSLNKIKIKNTAEGGVNLWMYIAGTDLYDPDGGSTCWSDVLGTSTNYIAIEEYMWYRGWTGTQWTSWEGWTQMNKYNQNDGCLVYGTCYGGTPLPQRDLGAQSQIPEYMQNVLTNQGTMEVEFKLTYPVPCIGSYSQGNIYVFGKAI